MVEPRKERRYAGSGISLEEAVSSKDGVSEMEMEDRLYRRLEMKHRASMREIWNKEETGYG